MGFKTAGLIFVAVVCSRFLIAQNATTIQSNHPNSAHQVPSRNNREDTASVRQRPVPSRRELVSLIRKSLVLISTQDHEGKDVAEASGFFIAPHLVATNFHVLKWAFQGYVKSADNGKKFKIDSVKAFSLNHDICVLYVPDASGVPLPVASEPAAVGDDILVAGNPEGLESTFSAGIVSGIRAEAGLLQIDAPISHGSSGGPVVDRQGKAIGLVVSSLVSGQNLNFAVPIQFLSDHMIERRMSARAAGHLAVTDREIDGFVGPVRSVTQKQSSYSMNEDTSSYIEGVATVWKSEVFDIHGRLKVSKHYSQGSETDSVLIEYSQDELELRETTVNAQGVRQSRELAGDEQMNVPASRIHYDETEEEGVKDTPTYASCKYNDFGQKNECFIAAQGARYVMQYDDSGRETDWLVYAGNNIRGKTHFTYDSNERGDWTVQHTTIWNAQKPELGFVPLMEIYRDITYYGSNDE